MSRSGYSEDCETWDLIRWRGAVTSAIKGRRGQAFLRELLAALDALPTKELIKDALQTASGQVCALGAVCASRGINATTLDPCDREAVGTALGIAPALVAEIAFENDESDEFYVMTPAKRWTYMREWVLRQIQQVAP